MKRVLCGVLVGLLLLWLVTRIFYSPSQSRLRVSGVEHLAKKETSPPRPSSKKSLLPNTAAAALVPGKFPAAFSPPPTPPRSVIVADYVMKQRARTRALYEGFLASVSLNKNDEEKVLDLLGRAEKAMFEETEEALQQERFPVAPSESEMRQRQGETDGELQSLLGGYEDFNRLRDYQASIPNQIVIDAMKEAGASLSDQQVKSTLAIMREERTRVMGSARLRNLDGVDPEVIHQMILSDQQQIHFATEGRLAPLLTPEQLAIFQNVMNNLEIAKSKP
jgi:hypothetical protein